jgi:AcrR family transcriptional regulator
MADIAVEAGISPGAIYRYFESKDDLAQFCFESSGDEVMNQWKDTQAHVDFNELARQTFSLLNQPVEREHTALMLESWLGAFRSHSDEDLAAVREEWQSIRESVERRLAEAQADGVFPAETDPQLLSQALFSFYWGARLQKLTDPDADTDGQLREVTRLIDLAAASRPGVAALP